MNFNNHSNLEGQHAFLGASKYHWINYGEDKVAEAYRNFLATQKGTVLHAFAAQCIMLNQKLPKSKQAGHDVVHGIIREVSLVLAGANPGAFIDDVVMHGDGETGIVIGYNEMIIWITGTTAVTLHLPAIIL